MKTETCIKTNADEDASPISCPHDGDDPPPSGLAPDPGVQGTRQSPHSTHLHPLSPYSIQSYTVPTHVILSIHLGPCFDQHPACGLAAILGSEMERGVLVLRGRGGALGGGERGKTREVNYMRKATEEAIG